MDNQAIDTAQDGGGAPATLLEDVGVAQELSTTPEVLNHGDDRSEVLDGGSPPEWLIKAVSGKEEEDILGTPPLPEPSGELTSTEVLSAGSAPSWSDVDDTIPE